mmetsp:Transcript_29779/g.49364  ORF Transcript_29779/g.49364 Transcript_29779/m.49364 type:complete len:107 (+) Transcript_29779:2600-2920(+)
MQVTNRQIFLFFVGLAEVSLCTFWPPHFLSKKCCSILLQFVTTYRIFVKHTDLFRHAEYVLQFCLDSSCLSPKTQNENTQNENKQNLSKKRRTLYKHKEVETHRSN